MKRRPPELKILPLEGEARSPEIFPLDETERPLPGEGGLPSLTKIVDEDWSGLASCFRKAFSVSSFPKDLVTLLVALLDGVDLLALACVSKDCLAFARGVSRCRFGADLSDLSAILTGKELLLDSTDSRGNVVLFRDGTFCALSHGAGYASMGNWTWDASLIGSWKKMDSSLLGNPALRFPKRILLEAKEWKGRARDEWYARSEHAPRDWKAASPKNLSSRVSFAYKKGDATGQYTLDFFLIEQTSKIGATLKPVDSARNPFSYWEKADSVQRVHPWLHNWNQSDMLLSPSGVSNGVKTISNLVESRVK